MSKRKRRSTRVEVGRAVAREVRPIGGGVVVSGARTLRWRWEHMDAVHRSRSFRCPAEQWYVVRCEVSSTRANTDALDAESCDLVIRFFDDEREIARRVVALERLPRMDDRHERIGWFQTPMHAKMMRVDVSPAAAAELDSITLRRVDDRRACSHPIANIPSGEAYAPRTPIRAVMLPTRLAGLETYLYSDLVEELPTPRTYAALESMVAGAAWILDPAWIKRLKLDWTAVRRLAAQSRVMIDVDTAARLLRGARLIVVEPNERSYSHDIPGARVEFAAAETRGFALMDVFPWAAVDERGRFVTRALDGGKKWDSFALATGFATLLTCESAAGGRGTQVLAAVLNEHPSAARDGPIAVRTANHNDNAVPFRNNGDRHTTDNLNRIRQHVSPGPGGGSIVISDAPWLLAGQWGMPVAADVVAHVWRMQLGLPYESDGQYIAPTDDPELLIRDVADFARRFPPMRPIRWTDGPGGTLRLGITMPISTDTNGFHSESRGAHVFIRSGRCDGEGESGFPAEAMMVLLRTLWRDGERRQRRLPHATRVTWQFEAGQGRRYVPSFDAAIGFPPPDRVLDWGERGGALRRIGLLGENSIALTEAVIAALDNVRPR